MQITMNKAWYFYSGCSKARLKAQTIQCLPNIYNQVVRRCKLITSLKRILVYTIIQTCCTNTGFTIIIFEDNWNCAEVLGPR